MTPESHPHNLHSESAHNPVTPEFVCSLERVSLSFGDRDVLMDVNLQLSATDHLAVLGDNGAGKSTLLRVLAGTLLPDGGERTVRIPGGVAYAAQAPMFEPGAKVQQVIDSYHHSFRELERLIQVLGARLPKADDELTERYLKQLQQVTDLYEARDGYTLSRRLDSALQQLGLGELDRSAVAAELSGGERSRLALACVLCSGAQLLLLDEPTNDLDDAALSWLERTLATHRGALVVVSHDRTFLTRFATSIVHVEAGQLTHYEDGYRGYLKARARERQDRIDAYATWSHELDRSRMLVEKNASRVAAIPRKQEKAGFGHGAFKPRSRSHGSTSKIRQAKSRIGELQSNPAPRPGDELQFRMTDHPGPSTGRRPLVQISNAQRFTAPSLRTGSIEIGSAERWLVTGPNGAGKSTLLKLIAGEIGAESGTVRRDPGLSVGWLRQELAEYRGQSVAEAYALALGHYLEDAIESLMRTGLFAPDDLWRHPQTLSAGQRRRLELAIAFGREVDLLLLDEPTNHLSPDLVEQLEAVLQDFPGTVVVVTHDRSWQQKFRKDSTLHTVQVSEGRVVQVR